ncbi:hypothetical protein [Azospirillum agricola]|uniref:hypothetical protein n=1 Tax=Azospirillum agricola TaxID=1720247 RepID=UPI000A0EF246|nr:hypothetical protein [Azospirillum agricola]SMH57450.1 hypothetical protein SAMN02982994_4314 [Azospirillum lipoferum]
MIQIVRSAQQLIGLIEDDAVITVLQPDTAYLTSRLCRELRDAVHAWSQGDRSPAARQQIEDLILVLGSMNLQVTIGVTDIFDIVRDLDAAQRDGLALLPGCDRPVLRLALQPKTATVAWF